MQGRQLEWMSLDMDWQAELQEMWDEDVSSVRGNKTFSYFLLFVRLFSWPAHVHYVKYSFWRRKR